MDFKDAHVHSGLSTPRAIHANHVREHCTMDCEAHSNSQAVTSDGRGHLVQDANILHHPSDPFESEDTVIKDLSVETLTHTEELSSAMSSLAEALAQCSVFSKIDVDIDKDDAVVRFATLFKQRIEDALEPLRAPVALVFQRRWEAERKRRQDLLAREEKKLVLRRKMIQLKRRRSGRGRRSTRRAIIASARASRCPTEVFKDRN